MFSQLGVVSSTVMEYLRSLNNVLNDQQVQLPAFEGEDRLRGSQPSPQTTEEQQTTVTSDQQPQLVGDVRLQIPDPDPEAEAEDGFSELGLRHFSIDQDRLESAVGVALGPDRSNPLWRLILIAAFNLVAATTAGVLFLPRNLEGVNATYWRVMLITSVGVPIAVAIITLFVCFWLASNPNGHSNLITGLSVANFSLLFAPLVVYVALQ